MNDAVRRVRLGRYAVAGLFFLNGYVIGNWAPKIPETALRLAISESQIGIILFAFGFGAILGLPLAGIYMSRFGSRLLSLLGAFLSSFILLALSLVPDFAAAIGVGFCFGLFLGGMDVAMNANAVSVERALKRPIMSSSHGFWSLGGLVGGATGGWMIATAGPVAHALVVTAVCLAIWAGAFFTVMSDQSDTEAGSEGTRFRLPRQAIVYLTGLLALMSMVPEGSVLDWAALFLIQERGADLTMSGFAFAGFSLSMAALRFFGDGLRARFGPVALFRLSAIVAAAGMLFAVVAASPWLAIAGFCVSGLGMANLVPIVLSAAGNLPGLRQGVGLSIATTLAYSGYIFVPTIIGFIAERTGFVPVYIGLAALLASAISLAGITRHAAGTH
ncbi:MAG: MFS transporter [Rhizobiaceae bacterium]